MKNIQDFLKKGTKESSMRLMSVRATNTACFIAILSVSGAVAGMLLAIVLDRDLAVIGAIIGALLGGTAGIVGTLLLPAFGGKAAQSKFELENPTKPTEGGK